MDSKKQWKVNLCSALYQTSVKAHRYDTRFYNGSRSSTCQQTRVMPAFTPLPQSVNAFWQVLVPTYGGVARLSQLVNFPHESWIMMRSREQLHWFDHDITAELALSSIVQQLSKAIGTMRVHRKTVSDKSLDKSRFHCGILWSGKPAIHLTWISCTFIVPRSNRQLSNSSFSVAAPSAWNRLPLHIRTSPTSTLFLSRLKTHLFAEVYLTVTPWYSCICIVFLAPQSSGCGRHSKFMLIGWLIEVRSS